MSAISTTPSACGAPARGSDIIDLLLRNEGERLRLSELLDGLHERAFGIAMALLVLPNCLPMPGIPYMSTLTGVPILMLAAQLMLGRDEPWLPQRIARWGMSRDRLARLWRRVRPGVATRSPPSATRGRRRLDQAAVARTHT